MVSSARFLDVFHRWPSLSRDELPVRRPRQRAERLSLRSGGVKAGQAASRPSWTDGGDEVRIIGVFLQRVWNQSFMVCGAHPSVMNL